MKSRFLKVAAKAALATGCALAVWNCGDDSSTGTIFPQTSGSSTSLCGNAVVKSSAWILNAGSIFVIYPDNSVTDANGNVVGSFENGNIVDALGAPVTTGIDLGSLEVCEANVEVDPVTGELTPLSSSATNPSSVSSSANVPNSSSSVFVPNMSSAFVPVDSVSSSSVDLLQSSSSVVPASSSAISSAVESSSSKNLAGGEFPSVESYGAPPAEYTKDILNNGKTGWNSRYWDACKPHCSWISNGQEGKTDTTTQESYVKGMTTTRNCNIHDVEVPTFTLGHAVQQYWFGYEGTNSACGDAKEKGVFTCTDMAPIAVNENLSYAYVAGPGSQTTCGKCFHLQYDGSFKDAGANNAPKATHQALKGKHIVVMTSNIGHDVEIGQFDLMVPGGGVGAYDALSVQVNGANVNWGAGFGGFLTECQSKLGYDNTLEKYQECVKDMCDAAFGNAGFPNLLRGCHWFADWYMAADNPTYNWEEVECPQYLIDHYMTTLNTTKDNRYKWHDDWSTFKQGDKLEEQECLTDEFPQGCKPN